MLGAPGLDFETWDLFPPLDLICVFRIQLRKGSRAHVPA